MRVTIPSHLTDAALESAVKLLARGLLADLNKKKFAAAPRPRPSRGTRPGYEGELFYGRKSRAAFLEEPLT